MFFFFKFRRCQKRISENSFISLFDLGSLFICSINCRVKSKSEFRTIKSMRKIIHYFILESNISKDGIVRGVAQPMTLSITNFHIIILIFIHFGHLQNILFRNSDQMLKISKSDCTVCFVLLQIRLIKFKSKSNLNTLSYMQK